MAPRRILGRHRLLRHRRLSAHRERRPRTLREGLVLLPRPSQTTLHAPAARHARRRRGRRRGRAHHSAPAPPQDEGRRHPRAAVLRELVLHRPQRLLLRRRRTALAAHPLLVPRGHDAVLHPVAARPDRTRQAPCAPQGTRDHLPGSRDRLAGGHGGPLRPAGGHQPRLLRPRHASRRDAHGCVRRGDRPDPRLPEALRRAPGQAGPHGQAARLRRGAHDRRDGLARGHRRVLAQGQRLQLVPLLRRIPPARCLLRRESARSRSTSGITRCCSS